MSSQKCLQRYKAGEFAVVWQKLKDLGEIRDESLKSEALAVARETMRRVKYNFNVIANNLIQLGFEFEEPEKVLIPAKTNDEKLDKNKRNNQTRLRCSIWERRRRTVS